MSVPANTNYMAYSVINALASAALGKDQTIQAVDSTSFASIGNQLLSIGYDRLTGAIDTVLTKTIFTERPYKAAFNSIFTDALGYGARIRKISVVDPSFEAGASWDSTNDRFLNDGEYANQQVVKKAKIVVENLVGGVQVKLQEYTKFDDVLDVAFSSEAELVQFWSMLLRNAVNVLEQAKENLARALVCTMIAQKAEIDSGNVYHLITEYNTALGLPRGTAGQAGYVPAYTATTIMDVYDDFIKWAYARIESISEFMGTRNIKYHFNFTNKPIARQTKKEDMIALFNSQFLTQVKNIVETGLYHDNLLDKAKLEAVPFWQDINDPQTVKMTIEPLQADGTMGNSKAKTVSNVIGTIFDKDMMMIYSSGRRVSAPYNASGLYQNTFNHYRAKYNLSLTENAAVFCLD